MERETTNHAKFGFGVVVGIVIYKGIKELIHLIV